MQGKLFNAGVKNIDPKEKAKNSQIQGEIENSYPLIDIPFYSVQLNLSTRLF